MDNDLTYDSSTPYPAEYDIVIDRYGYILQNTKKGNRVFLSEHDGLTYLGNLGGEIGIDYIYPQLLIKNGGTAKALWNPFKFRKLVKTRGEWDLKNNKRTIDGLANGTKTRFLYKEDRLESQDVGNHHFGYVSKAYGLFTEEFVLRQAGKYQIKSGTSKPEWQKNENYDFTLNANPLSAGPIVHFLPPPYGDNPRDQMWIQQGFDEYKRTKRNIREQK